ncbi:hypothetical protein [Sinimarinibacterium flocculans]|uniref:hypothetical protein n=1 Tax=Sinimarinibacterium flocculans TaxID=985250 RepID=UPI000D75BA23|nr:hypothetical protein [Sinimarinibacterium flocculans]MEC9362913.1 hypothetical protein [Pseudomonadota bacterium]
MSADGEQFEDAVWDDHPQRCFTQCLDLYFRACLREFRAVGLSLHCIDQSFIELSDGLIEAMRIHRCGFRKGLP